MKAWTVGRSKEADIVLTDSSVSRTHAELVETDEGRFYLTDCGSSFGTFLKHGDADWQPVRQVYVEPTDRLRLGEYEMTVEELIALAPRDAADPQPAPQQVIVIDKATEPSEGSELPHGPVERDPLTGRIIKRDQ